MRGVGVLIAVKNDIPCSLVQCDSSLEIICIRVELDFRPALIGACYRPPSTNPGDFNESLYICLGTLKSAYLKDILKLAGNFNYPGIDWETLQPFPNSGHSSHYNEFLCLLEAFELTQMVNVPTRDRATLDLFLISNAEYGNSTNVIDLISDHATVHVETSFTSKHFGNCRK